MECDAISLTTKWQREDPQESINGNSKPPNKSVWGKTIKYTNVQDGISNLINLSHRHNVPMLLLRALMPLAVFLRL